MICESLTRDIILTVDAEQVQKHRDILNAAERQRIEEMRARRRKLVDLRDQDELPLKEFTEAMLINEKPPDELTPQEKSVKRWLDRLLAEKISAAEYLEFLQGIPPPPPPPKAIFCIHCGARNVADNVFCFQCGKRLK